MLEHELDAALRDALAAYVPPVPTVGGLRPMRWDLDALPERPALVERTDAQLRETAARAPLPPYVRDALVKAMPSAVRDVARQLAVPGEQDGEVTLLAAEPDLWRAAARACAEVELKWLADYQDRLYRVLREAFARPSLIGGAALTPAEAATLTPARLRAVRRAFKDADPATWTVIALREIAGLVAEGVRSSVAAAAVEGEVGRVIDEAPAA